MLKHFNKSKMKKTIRKAACVTTVAAMLMMELPIGVLPSITESLAQIMTVRAVGSYDAVNKIMTIESWHDLVDYSAVYDTDIYNHTEDTIYINFTGDTEAPFTGYKSIGSDSNPFKGKILFNINSARNFNVGVPLFGTICDNVEFLRKTDEQGGTELIDISIRKIASNENEPLFAKKVQHDSTVSTAVGWTVTSSSKSGETIYSNAGFIEEIGSNTKVKLTAFNNAIDGTSGQANIQNDDDAGVICGKMGSNSELTIENYTGTNENYTVTSTGGHAGGLVGSLGTNSELIITEATNLQKIPAAYVKSGLGKYAGGLVGYNNGGSVIYNGSTSYEIKQMISGGSGEGGLFGYYKPRTSDNMLTLDVSHYSIDCRLNSGAYAGGLIGQLENNGKLTISGAPTVGYVAAARAIVDEEEFVQSTTETIALESELSATTVTSVSIETEQSVSTSLSDTTTTVSATEETPDSSMPLDSLVLAAVQVPSELESGSLTDESAITEVVTATKEANLSETQVAEVAEETPSIEAETDDPTRENETFETLEIKITEENKTSETETAVSKCASNSETRADTEQTESSTSTDEVIPEESILNTEDPVDSVSEIILSENGVVLAGDSTPAYVTIKSEHAKLSDTSSEAAAQYYGGLIGYYKTNALTNTLCIEKLNTNAKNTLGAANKFGGCIAETPDSAYIEFDTIEVDATGQGNASGFGGLIDIADNSYVYAKGIKIGSSAEIGSFAGGGLINSLTNGVLRMGGSINLSNAKPSSAATNGQIVAVRDNALIYADAGWTFTRSTATVDNVGSWGDVIVFNTLASGSASGGKLVKANVLTENSDHTITITTPTSNSITSAEDFAKISILRQIDIGNATNKNRILSGTNIAASTVLSSSGTIYLKGTGLRGITRDNGTTNVEYSGSTFDGNSGTIVLDIQNVGGKPVYYHTLNGLFGLATGTEFENVTFSGTININGQVDSIYVGTAAATTSEDLKLTSCSTSDGLTITIGGEKAGYAGRMVGCATSSIGDITVSGGTYDGTLQATKAKSGYRLGGVIGGITHASNVEKEWEFSGVTLKGTVKNTDTTTSEVDQKLGGLIASIDGYTPSETKDLRTLTLDVDIDALEVSGKTPKNMGGLLGYSWANTNVVITDVSLTSSSTVSLSAAGHVAGLVSSASGHWTITKLDLSNIKIVAGTAASIGFIVNKGYTTKQTSGIYLELDPSVYTLSLTNDSLLPTQTDASKFVYDEICAYSSSDGIMTNGQGIISIKSTGGLKMETNATSSLSYPAKTTKGQDSSYENPNTRYYYNLDAVDDRAGTLSDAAKKLMRWGVWVYACTNVKPYFTNDFTIYSGTTLTGYTIPSGTYKMQGYSWYPVTIGKPMNVAGTFEFFNEEFESCENAKTNTKLSPNSKTQHYMMQNGLLYNVTSSVTIGDITLKGTIGAVDTSGTGALIYGNVSGADADHITIISSKNATNGISLDGIRVWNYGDVSETYAPLLINKSGGYTTFEIYHVSNTNNTAYTGGDTVATSLIGRLGELDSSTKKPTSKYLNVTFSDVKLDGRNAVGKCTQLNTGYNYYTTRSLFSRATLLERFSYDTDSSGVYNFTYDEDWGGTKKHKVTYGQELGYVTGNPSEVKKNQYPDQELQYSGSSNYVAYKQNNNGPFTSADSTVSNTFRGEFLRYVADVDTTNYKYQLMVNHHSVTLTGCGTYNDPYIINGEASIEGISRMIRNTFNVGDTLCVPYGGVNATWCHNKATPDHVTFSYDGANFKATGQTAIDKTDIAQHLAGAYYQIVLPTGTTSITISNENDFQGLGSSSAATMFRGVIDGNDYTIVNQTKYPLIAFSNGSVVKDLTVQLGKNVTVSGANQPFGVNNANGAYGTVIGQIHGGDNIIDKVTINNSSYKITASGGNAQLAPIGGYVGVVVNGGLIFRNMSTIANSETSKLLAANVTTNQTAKVVSDMTATTSTHAVTDDLWLYVNPYVGRVINGYAVNEAGAYHAREANQTLKNGTKHYSITDIGENTKLSVSDSTITIPDSQSFFMLSLIINSGMGSLSASDSTTPGLLGYYNNYCVTRHADYDEIGEATSDDYDDYASKDVYWSNTKTTTALKQADQPYLMQGYVSSLDAKAIGQKDCTVNLTKGVTYALSDGYKGIGNIFNDNNALRLNVSKFNGKACTIDQNTRYVSYSDGQFLPVSGGGHNNSAGDLGLGLFNTQKKAGTFSDFTLSGKVRSDVINRATGNSVDYTLANTHQRYALSTGMLIGIAGASITVKNVILSNVDVRSAKYSGGFIGCQPWQAGNNIKIEQEESYSGTSSGITVHGVTGVGGMIGKIEQGTPTINYHGHNFNITGVYCDVNDSSMDYKYGVGGIIGVCRAGGGEDKNSKVVYAGEGTITGVKIGTADQTRASYVQCTVSDKGVNAGGLMGTLNRCSPNVSNCTINNLSVSSNASDTYVGGAVGFVTTYCKVTVNDVHLYSNNTVNARVSGNGYCGGILGQSPLQATDGTLEFTLSDSSIDGYTVSGKTVGGIVGERNSWRTSSKYAAEATGTTHLDGFDMNIKNFEIKNCSVTGTGTDNIAGGLIGKLITPIKGYNVHATNLTVTGSTKGYIIGQTDDNDKGLIKLVAFSRQETRDGVTMLAQIVGSSTKGYEYGINGYVVFADYKGTDTNHSFSAVNYIADEHISPVNSPYVHVNPSATFDGTKILTGDGVSPLELLANGYYVSDALKSINNDTQANKPNYIKAVDGYNVSDLTAFKTNMQKVYDTYAPRLSTFQREANEKLKKTDGTYTNYDFPVLVLDISNTTQATAYLNQYIHLLTNTPTDDLFANFATRKGISGSDIGIEGVYNVKMTKYKYDKTNNCLVEIPTTDTDAYQYGLQYIPDISKFSMNADKTDTVSPNAQFTLLDVQFYDPSDVSKIAYHLYIPVYCRKLLEYDFRIHLASGTNYKRTDPITGIGPQTAGEKDVLIENSGVPVTIEFTYTYKRSVLEWQNALDGGDSLLTPFTPRKLEFKNLTYSTGTLPSLPDGTTMVLVDVNRGGKAYYLSADDLNTAFSTPDSNSLSYLDLSKFKDSSETPSSFEPLTFSDMLKITAVSDPTNGKFVECVSNDSRKLVKVKGNGEGNDTYYRLIDESDPTDIDKYSITVDEPDNEDENYQITEHYFLTIYTPDEESDDSGEGSGGDPSSPEPESVVYHYEIGTKDALTDDNVPYPTKAVLSQRSDLYFGEIYSNNVFIQSQSDPTTITTQNNRNSITTELKAEITLTQAGIDNVSANLDKASLYQSFLLKLNKFHKDQNVNLIGIQASSPSIVVSGGMICPENALENEKRNLNLVWSGNSNYIEVKASEDPTIKLSEIIQTNTSNQRKTEIYATVQTVFPEDDISLQFYPVPTTAWVNNDDPRWGTAVLAYSNISSTYSQTAYSNVSDSTRGSKLYYTDKEQGATLVYDAISLTDQGPLPQLGINRRDNKEPVISVIQSQANYDISNCQNETASCDFVKCEFQLKQRQDTGSYGAALDMSKYLINVTAKAKNATNNQSITLNSNETTDTLTFIFDKSVLDYNPSTNTYTIPIELTIKSGDDFEEAGDLVYSNYKVELEVSMLTTESSTTKKAVANDWLIYTHAKVYTGRVDPAKTIG